MSNELPIVWTSSPSGCPEVIKLPVSIRGVRTMNKLLFAAFVALIGTSAIFNGCTNRASNGSASASAATAPSHPAAAYQADHRYGVVESIYTNKSDVNAGTLIGGALGGLAGHQVGGGSGQTVTTIAGAVGGAIVGTKVANRNEVLQITVKLDDG